MKSASYYTFMVENAIQTAYNAGYRPCDQCAGWYKKEEMVMLLNENNLLTFSCSTCALPERETTATAAPLPAGAPVPPGL